MSVLLLSGTRVVAAGGGGGILWAPNQPAGYTVYGDTTFVSDSPEPSGWNIATAADFPVRQPGVVADSGPFAPNSYRVRMPSGLTDGDCGFIDANAFTAVSQVYFCFTFRTSSGWVNESSVTKIVYPDNLAEVGIQPNGATNSGQYKWSLTTFPSGGGGAFLVGTTAFANDTTYLVEVEMVRNTGDSANGRFRLWVGAWTGSNFATPTLELTSDSVKYAGTSQGGVWTSPRWNVYRGGAGTPTLSAEQFCYFNRVRLASRSA